MWIIHFKVWLALIATAHTSLLKGEILPQSGSPSDNEMYQATNPISKTVCTKEFEQSVVKTNFNSDPRCIVSRNYHCSTPDHHP